jgi:hypothetical protein
MTTNKTSEKTITEYVNQIVELEKENKKLREINDGLVRTQIKVLQNAIRGDQETVVSNEETIQNGRKMAELSVTVEKSAKEIEARAEHVVSTTRTVGEGALAVVAAAEKTNEQKKKNINHAQISSSV